MKLNNPFGSYIGYIFDYKYYTIDDIFYRLMYDFKNTIFTAIFITTLDQPFG